MKKKVEFRKKTSKVEFKKPFSDVSESAAGNYGDASYLKVDAASYDGKAGDVSADEVGLTSQQVKEVLKPVAKRIHEAAVEALTTGVAEVWFPGKRALTVREEAQRDRDCKVEYSTVVPSSKHKELDAERRAGWIPPAEVEKMPQWKPVLQPVVDQVVEESVKEVAQFMDAGSREEKTKVVEKLVGKVLKKLPGHDKGLVEKRLFDTLFALAKDQGVVNRRAL